MYVCMLYSDEDGGRVHDLLGTRCDPYVRKLLANADFDYHCHSNLTRAVLPFGLTEFDVHDVLNVFQCTGASPAARTIVLKLINTGLILLAEGKQTGLHRCQQHSTLLCA